MFNKLAFTYIVGIGLGIGIYNQFAVLMILLTLIIINGILLISQKYFINNVYILYIKYYFISFTLGILVFCLHQLTFPTMLTQDHYFAPIYGEVYKVQSHYNQPQARYIYVKYLNISNDNQQFNLSAKFTTYNNKLKYGDIFKANANLYTPNKPFYPGGFNFYKYTQMNGYSANGYILHVNDIIYQESPNKIFNIFNKLYQNYQGYSQQKLENKFKNHTQHHNLISAIILGKTNLIDKPTKELFNKSALAHLLAISGYHIGLISLIVFFISRFLITTIPKFPLLYNTKTISSILTIVILLVYIVTIDAHTPAIRATIIAIIIFLGIILNIRTISLNNLFFVAIILITIKPSLLLSASFLLSFYATFGLIILWNYPLVKKWLLNTQYRLITKIFVLVISYFISSLFIEILLSPVIGFYFGVIPLLGMLSNVVAIPIFSFITMPSILLGLVTPSIIAQYIFQISDYSLDIIIQFAQYITTFDIATTKLLFFPNWIMYLIMSCFIIISLYNNRFKFITIPVVVIAISYYVCYISNPTIVTDSQMHNIVIKSSTNSKQYTIIKKNNSFLVTNWLRKDYQATKTTDAQCHNDLCIYYYDQYVISFISSNIYYQEACENADAVITNSPPPFHCTKAKTIYLDHQYHNYLIYLNPQHQRIRLIHN